MEEAEMMEFKATIGGRPAHVGSDFAVLNPATGGEVGRAPNMGGAELDAAVAVAKAAFASWSAQSDEALQAACAAVTAKIEEHAAELAEGPEAAIHADPLADVAPSGHGLDADAGDYLQEK